jgi:hypothetical protein
VCREAWSATFVVDSLEARWLLWTQSLPACAVSGGAGERVLILRVFAVMADPVLSVAYAIEAPLRALGGHLNLLLATIAPGGRDHRAGHAELPAACPRVPDPRGSLRWGGPDREQLLGGNCRRALGARAPMIRLQGDNPVDDGR